MLYFHRELKENLKSNYKIQKNSKRKKFFKVDDGLHLEQPNASYIEITTKKYSNFVIYGNFSYYYHFLMILFQVKSFWYQPKLIQLDLNLLNNLD